MDEKHDQVSRRRDISCQLGPTSDDFKASLAEESRAPLLTHPTAHRLLIPTLSKVGQQRTSVSLCEWSV